MIIKQEKLERRSHLYWHLIFLTVALGALFVVIRGLTQVLVPVVSALVLAYLLDPLVGFLQRRFKLARWVGTTLLFFIAMIITVLAVLLLLPVIVHELQSFAAAVPGYVARIRDTLIPWMESTFGVTVPHTLDELSTRAGANLQALATQLMGPLGGVAGRVIESTAGVFSTVGTLVLIPVFTFYFLPKYPQITAGALELIPPRYRAWVSDTAREIDRVLAAWIRGQVTVMACLAVAYSIGLSIVGIQMAVLIGVITGTLAFIPYVGFGIGAIMAIIVCLLEYQGPGQLVGVAIVFAVVQAAEGFVLTPYLVGDRVGLGPVGVLLALLIGGSLFGFVGVLLAVPVAAAVVVVLRRALSAYRSSAFFCREDAAP